jgi:hypothetical protein
LAGLVAVYAATRLARLDALPAFLEEARHLNWSQRFLSEWPFLKPLEDGKLLQIAITSAVLPLSTRPLHAARTQSVVVGALGLLAAWRLGREVGGEDRGEAVGVLAAALYVASPFMLVYDRMNLADVYLSTSTAVALVITLRVAGAPSAARGALLGLALAACVLAKVPGLLVFGLPLCAALLPAERTPRLWKALAIAYAVAVVLVALPVGYFFLHSSQLGAKTGAADEGRLAVVVENVGLAASWLWSYWTPPVLVLGCGGAVVAAVRGRRAELLLAAAAALPVGAFTLLAYHWFPRYVLPATIPVLVLAACALAEVAARLGRAGPVLRAVAPAALALVFLPAVLFDARLLDDPASAPLPAVDRFQLVDGWPSGYGWREAFERLRQERALHPEGIKIVTDRAGHHTGQWVLKAYFMGDAGVEVLGLEMDDERALGVLEAYAATAPTYFATGARARRFEGTPALEAEHLGTFRKPNGAFVCNVYRLRPRA